jgi:LmbE family N-acetylglucosaminyl deacetylase
MGGLEEALRFLPSAMTSLKFDQIKTVLCLGAHSDDIEIGCGGTVMKLAAENDGLTVFWVVFTADGRRQAEARASARVFLSRAAKAKIIIKQFRNGFFPFQGERIKEFFEELKERVKPDVVFTHYRDDRHQDHRTISDLTWNTFRNHLILEYEIPKYDGDLGVPNLFVSLNEGICQAKTQQLCRFFRTQSNKHWFTPDTFLALMRLRGIECASKYAEAFHGRKLVLDLGSSTRKRE